MSVPDTFEAFRWDVVYFLLSPDGSANFAKGRRILCDASRSGLEGLLMRAHAHVTSGEGVKAGPSRMPKHWERSPPDYRRVLKISSGNIGRICGCMCAQAQKSVASSRPKRYESRRSDGGLHGMLRGSIAKV